MVGLLSDESPRQQRELGEAEIEHLHPALARDEDVRGLDVAVQDALAVRGVEGIRDLHAEIEQEAGGHRLAVDDLVERLPLEQLHREEPLSLELVDGVDGADVRMVEGRRGARLALEPFDGRRRGRHFGRQELQRDRTAEPEILGLVHDTHAARADALDDLVMRDGAPDHGPPILASLGSGLYSSGPDRQCLRLVRP